MSDTDGRWITHEIADVVATATELGRRRNSGDPISHRERVQLQRRKVEVLRAIAARTPGDLEIRDVTEQAERNLRELTAEPAAPETATDVHRSGLVP